MPDDSAATDGPPSRAESSASKASRSGPAGATQPESNAAISNSRSSSPTSGGESGGTRVTITGTGFTEPLRVLFGSDPSKAPRRINRWGAATEITRYQSAGNEGVAHSAFWGFMKDEKH